MIKIAVTGHRPDSFLVSHYKLSDVEKICDETVQILKKEYCDDLLFNIGGALGSDQWVGNACLVHNVKFDLYLPFHPSVQARYWTKGQKSTLDTQLKKACSIHIVDPDPNIPLNSLNSYNVLNYTKRNEEMVDHSSFTIAFWVGKRKGGTYNAIKYTLKKSKFVFNALNELKPIFGEDIKNGWTPIIKIDGRE
jgi:uncharacterized phage-like protein YoqJ